MSTMLQGKTYILLALLTMKSKLKTAAKEWTDNKTFRFRIYLLWTGLGGNYLYGQKHFREMNNSLCKVSTT